MYSYLSQRKIQARFSRKLADITDMRRGVANGGFKYTL
jgi:hypothetical protein